MFEEHIWVSLEDPHQVTNTYQTGANMNYSGPIYLAVILGSATYWILWGKSNWPGLNSKAIEMVEAHD